MYCSQTILAKYLDQSSPITSGRLCLGLGSSCNREAIDIIIQNIPPHIFPSKYWRSTAMKLALLRIFLHTSFVFAVQYCLEIFLNFFTYGMENCTITCNQTKRLSSLSFSDCTSWLQEVVEVFYAGLYKMALSDFYRPETWNCNKVMPDHTDWKLSSGKVFRVQDFGKMMSWQK